MNLSAILAEFASDPDIPGIAAAVIGRSGIKETAVAGVRSVGDSQLVTTGDQWHIGSATKAMTAAAYARMVDQGLTQWGLSIPELFPDLQDTIDADWYPITVENLLHHRAGLDDVEYRVLSAAYDDPLPLPDQRSVFAREKLSRNPKKRVGEFSYSNAGYILVGAAIERITLKSWEDSVREYLFEPLKMKTAGFGPPQGDAPQGHRSTGFGSLCAVGKAPDADNPMLLGPAGSIHLTLTDWAAFLRQFLGSDQSYLSDTSLNYLLTPPDGTSYAMGWLVNADPEHGRIVSHAGSNTRWLAQATIFQDHNAATIVATNAVTAAAQEAVRDIGKMLAESAIH